MTGWEVRHGDTLLALRELGAGTVDAVVTDPPYLSGEYVDISRRRLAAVAASGADVARSAPSLFDVEGDA